METDKLDIIKERLKIEGLNGDIAEAARRAKTSSTTVLRALEKERYNDIRSPKQIAGLKSLVGLLNVRKIAEAELEKALHLGGVEVKSEK